MSFDPTQPVNGIIVDANFLRAQFNALKDLCDTQATQIADLTAQNAGQEERLSSLEASMANRLTQADIEPITANNIDSVVELSMTLSNPPQLDEVQAILDKVNEAVSSLHR